MSKKPRGVVIFEGPSLLDRSEIVSAIAIFKSDNKKTGDMVQVYIITTHLHPVEAIKQGRKQGTCGHCPLLGTVCYIRPEQAPRAVWDGNRRGIYPAYNDKEHRHLFQGRKLRWGADGDPAALPVPLVRKFSAIVAGHTGYTHQADDIPSNRAEALSEFLMISTETEEQVHECTARGWRSFRVRGENQPLLPGEIDCPHYTHGVQCDTCNLCNGTSGSCSKHISVVVHGITSKIAKHSQLVN